VGAGLLVYVFSVIATVDSLDLPTNNQTDQVFRATVKLAEKQLIIRSLQLAAGYGTGFFCVFAGVILAWCGVSGQVEFKASDGAKNVSFTTGSVGAAIALGGAILISIAMFSRPIKVESTGGIKFENSFGGGATSQMEL
jgi:hypothetical protein